MDSDLALVNGKSGRQSWRHADAFQRSIISEAIYHFTHIKGKADDLYRGSMQSEDHRRTALQYLSFIGPNMPLPTIRRFWHEGPRKVPRYQVILLGEQRHMSSNVSYDSPIMQVVQRVLDSWRLAASWAVYTT